LKYLHEKFGQKPWKNLFKPTIKLAREGFKVTEDLEFAMVAATDGRYGQLGYDPALSGPSKPAVQS
jgi:gamma-glutamyltranspeptidase